MVIRIAGERKRDRIYDPSGDFHDDGRGYPVVEGNLISHAGGSGLSGVHFVVLKGLMYVFHEARLTMTAILMVHTEGVGIGILGRRYPYWT